MGRPQRFSARSVTTPFALLKNPWNQLSTSFIVAKVVTQGDKSTMTLW